MPHIPKCSVCGAEIVEPLSEVSGATDWVCLECSGATIEDFDESDRVHEMRTFHGKSQWD